MEVATLFLKCYDEDPSVLEWNVTRNGAWVHHRELESKRQRIHWNHPSSPVEKKFTQEENHAGLLLGHKGSYSGTFSRHLPVQHTVLCLKRNWNRQFTVKEENRCQQKNSLPATRGTMQVSHAVIAILETVQQLPLERHPSTALSWCHDIIKFSVHLKRLYALAGFVSDDAVISRRRSGFCSSWKTSHKEWRS